MKNSLRVSHQHLGEPRLTILKSTLSPAISRWESVMILSDLLLQVLQVLCVLLLAPLLQHADSLEDLKEEVREMTLSHLEIAGDRVDLRIAAWVRQCWCETLKLFFMTWLPPWVGVISDQAVKVDFITQSEFVCES